MSGSGRRGWRRSGVLASVLLATAALAADGTPTRTFEAEVMATRFSLLLPASEEASAAADAVFTVFSDVDERMSEWKDSSPLSAVNREAGVTAVAVPDDLREVLVRGVGIGRASGGAFDVTWAAMWGLWDFRSPDPHPPDPDEAARRAKLVDYREVVIDPKEGTVLLRKPGMKLGLGGIAKGWALDRAAAVLRTRGVDSFLISGGGQVQAGGTRADGTPWRVGIRDPRGATDDFFAIVEVSDQSVSTSGDYERFFEVDGVRYHHILDPRTGQPARGLRSVTTVSSDATLADGMSTAIFVLGVEAGLELAERTPDLEAVLVDEGGQVHATAGIHSQLTIVHAPRTD